MFLAGIDAHATYSVIAIVSNTGQLVAGPIRIKNTQGPVKRHGIQVSKETWVTVGSSQEVADAVRGDPCRGRTKTLHR